MEEGKTCFYVYVTGQIESGHFPLGPDSSQVFCKMDFACGPDWELVNGIKTGITQSSVGKNNYQDIIFNMPIEVTYKSTNPYGWPQVIITVYGKSFWGTEILLGYARALVPILGKQKLTVPILIPRSSNILGEFSNWITKKNPELKNPQILTNGLKGIQTESYGKIILILQTISRGVNKLGYDLGTDNTNSNGID